MILLVITSYIVVVCNYASLCRSANAPELPVDLRWVSLDWRECNVTCGTGSQSRDVFCAEHYNNSQGTPEIRKMDDSYCNWQEKKPDERRTCNPVQCPAWEVGDWSECSATCGNGSQNRRVVCRYDKYHDFDDDVDACRQSEKPTSIQQCKARITCEEAERNRLADYERYRYVAAAPYTQWDDAGDSRRGQVSHLPHWLPGQWSDCSTTCGPGVKNRKLDCVVIMPITQNQMVWPAYECDGKPKPEEFLPCEVRQCPHSLQSHEASQVNIQPFINEDSQMYKWEYGPLGPCSASCLGGVQYAALKCVNRTGQQVDMANCNPNQRLANFSQPCNTGRLCPQHWETFPWSPCSHKCGGGSQTRKVRCQQEIGKSRASSNIIILDDQQCLNMNMPKPRDRQACAMEDCPPYWEAGKFQPCSTTCGSGERRRSVVCKQVIVGGTVIIHDPPKACSELPPIPAVELCKFDPCPVESYQKANMRLLKQQKPHDNMQNQENRKGVTLQLPAAQASLFEGRNVKIKCPVKDFDRSRIKWLKDGQRIESPDFVRDPEAYKHKVIISKNGALRIFSPTMKDNGVYTCVGDKVYGNITLIFKPDDDYNNKQGKFKGNKMKQKPHQTGKTNSIYTNIKPTNYDRTNDLVVDPSQPDWSQERSRNNAPAPSIYTSLTDRLTAGASGDQRDKFQSNVSLSKSGDQSLLDELAAELSAQNLFEMHAALQRANNIKAVKIEWVVGPWGTCPQTCTKAGMAPSMKVRSVHCRADVELYSANVSDPICKRAGLDQPYETEMCGFEPCPKEHQTVVRADWEVGEFSPCATSTCKRYSTGVVTRNVYCKFPNGTRVSERFCRRRSNPKPTTEGECLNQDCVGVWSTTDWSHCTRTCGRDGEGVQLRALTCVWKGTQIPAGMGCSGAARPNATQPCHGLRPCPKSNDITGLFKGWRNWRGWDVYGVDPTRLEIPNER